MPSRGSKGSAGLDLYASESLVIKPNRTVIVPTSIYCQFNRGWAAFIWDRSSFGFRGIHRFAGVIDSDYDGEWGVVLHNTKSQEVVVNKGDRVAQVVFQRVWFGGPKTNKTREGGFGSTGK